LLTDLFVVEFVARHTGGQFIAEVVGVFVAIATIITGAIGIVTRIATDTL
jgi:hypothetical protein